MGLFSKKKTYVESFSMPLVEDTPNFVQQSILTSVRKERPITEDLVANMINGLGARLSRYFNYGRDSYEYGLPEGTTNLNHVPSETVALCIEYEKGFRVLMDYSIFGSPDPLLFGEDFLVNQRGYDLVTEEITNPPFDPTGTTVTVDAIQFLNQTTIEIEYKYGTQVTPLYYTETTTVPAVSLDQEYYHTAFYEVDASGNALDTRMWWYYKPVDGTYPTLDIDESTKVAYYPVVPLRYNNTDYTTDDGSNRYKTSKRLLKKLDLDIDKLGSAINENPDVGDIDYAFIVMGVSTQTTTVAGKNYLFNYFQYLEEISQYKQVDWDRWVDREPTYKTRNPPFMNKVIIKEAGISYNTELGYLYITRDIKTGSIGDVGTVTTGTTVQSPYSAQYYNVETSYLTIRKQQTENTYEELVVHGLKHINYVYGSHTVDTTLADAVNSAADDDTFLDGMLIPLCEPVVLSMSLPQRTELAYDAVKITFNCVVVQKLKWYQTSFFQFFTILVSIALTIFSFGSLSGSLAWAAALVGSTSVIVGAVVLGVITIGIQYGIAYLVDVIGIEASVLLAIIGVMIPFAGLGMNPALMSALQSGILQGTQLAMDWEMEDILNDYDALQREMEEAQRELDEISEGLGLDGLIDPMIIANHNQGLALPNETPEQYYNTRIHFGNLAGMAPLAVSNYVENEIHLEGTTLHNGLRI